jgi:hypothetical protein
MRVDVFDWAKSKHASIVYFQETHSNNNIEKYWEDEWGNKCVFSHHDSKSAGVCVMFKKGSKTTFQSPHNKILVFEKVNTFCNIILNSEGSSVL